MSHLPLFPLNTILFPKMPITLHIFEDRYKQMIQHCLSEQVPFGVVLIKQGVETGGSAQPHLIGCTARITHTHHLQDGRLNLLAIGEERFEIETLHHDQPYLSGTISPLPLLEEQNYSPNQSNCLYKLVKQYMDLLAETNQVDIKGEIPTHPIDLAYLAATILQLPAKKKQPLLETNNANQLLTTLIKSYRQELPILRFLSQDHPPHHMETMLFSLN